MKLKALLLCAAVAAVPALAAAPAPLAGVKNIIIIINDGAGPTVYDATRLYLGHPLVTDGATFKKTYVSTYPLRPDSSANNKPGSTVQDPATVYVSSKFWDTTPVAGPSTAAGYSAYPAAFQGYEFSRFAHPDSGNTASSLSNGVKSYNNAINVDGGGEPQFTVVESVEAAHLAGKSTGVVSTVQFSDATPAALGGAHNPARANHFAIADEMFSAGLLDVIGGAGNPDYNDDGNPRVATFTPESAYWISAPLWTDLKNGTNTSGKNAQNWPLLQQKVDIDALALGLVKPPRRVAMIMRADTSSQFNRSGDTTNPAVPHTKPPFTDPANANVPTQANLTLAALNTLGQNGRGFYLMSEAGAVDRAEHANNTARMIEEQIASDDTVKAIIDWVNRADTAATWDNTLLIVTADHDHLLYGPDGATVPFQPLIDNGPGHVPGNQWFGPNHGDGLVPLFAYGKGAAQVVALATSVDAYTDAQGRKFGHGKYVDQTVLGSVLKATAGQNN